MHLFQLVLYVEEHPSSLCLVSAKAANIRKVQTIQCAAPSYEHVLKTEDNKILAEGKEELVIAHSPGGSFAGGLSVVASGQICIPLSQIAYFWPPCAPLSLNAALS